MLQNMLRIILKMLFIQNQIKIYENIKDDLLRLNNKSM